MSIPPDLNNLLHATLLRCEAFESDRALRAVFADARIDSWRHKIPHADSPDERTKEVVDYLHRQTDEHGENALVLLLRVLSEQMPSADARHQELTALAEELEREFKLRSSQPEVPETFRYEVALPDVGDTEAQNAYRNRQAMAVQMPECPTGELRRAAHSFTTDLRQTFNLPTNPAGLAAILEQAVYDLGRPVVDGLRVLKFERPANLDAPSLYLVLRVTDVDGDADTARNAILFECITFAPGQMRVTAGCNYPQLARYYTEVLEYIGEYFPATPVPVTGTSSVITGHANIIGNGSTAMYVDQLNVYLSERPQETICSDSEDACDLTAKEPT